MSNSYNPMIDLKELAFFSIPAHECSYLEGREAKTLFADPFSDISNDTYSRLSDLGFRRSGKHIYRPYCDACQACISVRVPTEHFRPSKSQKRVISKNNDLDVKIKPPYYSDTAFDLYQRYIHIRHHDGDMYPPSKDQFISFLVEGNQKSQFIEFYLGQRLVAIAVVDILNQGLSATYTFFDPESTLQKRSLGSYAILWQLMHCKAHALPYLYLGYWVKACRKMNYKTHYQPLECLIEGCWVPFK